MSGLRFEDEAEFVHPLAGGRVAGLNRTGSFAAVANGAMRDDDTQLSNAGGLREFLLSSSVKLGLRAPDAPCEDASQATAAPISAEAASAAAPATRVLRRA